MDRKKEQKVDSEAHKCRRVSLQLCGKDEWAASLRLPVLNARSRMEASYYQFLHGSTSHTAARSAEF